MKDNEIQGFDDNWFERSLDGIVVIALNTSEFWVYETAAVISAVNCDSYSISSFCNSFADSDDIGRVMLEIMLVVSGVGFWMDWRKVMMQSTLLIQKSWRYCLEKCTKNKSTHTEHIQFYQRCLGQTTKARFNPRVEERTFLTSVWGMNNRYKKTFSPLPKN